MKGSAWFLRHSAMSKIGRTARLARSAATSADDSVSPPGRPSRILSVRDLGGDVVGIRMHGDAVDRFQQRQLDEILALDETADRQRRGDHQQGIAGIGIGEAVHQAGIGQRHGDVGEFGIGDVADRHQGLRRRLHGVGKGQRPFVAGVAAGQRGHLRAVEADADGLALLERKAADVADQRAALDADRLDVERLRRNRTPATPHRRDGTRRPASMPQRRR